MFALQVSTAFSPSRDFLMISKCKKQKHSLNWKINLNHVLKQIPLPRCRKCTWHVFICSLAPTWNKKTLCSRFVITKPVTILQNKINPRADDAFSRNTETDPLFTSSQLRESCERESEGARWGDSRSLITHRRAASPRERTTGREREVWEREHER